MAQFKGAPSLFGQNIKEEPVKQEKKQAEEKSTAKEEAAKITKTEKETPKKTQTTVKKAEPEKKAETIPEPVVTKTVPAPEPVIEAAIPAPYVSRLHVETDKSRVGRPRQEGEFKMVSVRLTLENYETAIIDGAQYGGLTGFVNYLIRTYSENNKK